MSATDSPKPLPGRFRIFRHKPKFHNQILRALLVGALFGALFNVDTHKLKIVHRVGETERDTGDAAVDTVVARSEGVLEESQVALGSAS